MNKLVAVSVSDGVATLTLERVEKQGSKGFYEGETAKLLAKDMAAHGGHITAEDMRRYAVREGFVDVCDGNDLRAGDLLIVFEMLLGSLSRADQPHPNGPMF